MRAWRNRWRSLSKLIMKFNLTSQDLLSISQMLASLSWWKSPVQLSAAPKLSKSYQRIQNSRRSRRKRERLWGNLRRRYMMLMLKCIIRRSERCSVKWRICSQMTESSYVVISIHWQMYWALCFARECISRRRTRCLVQKFRNIGSLWSLETPSWRLT